MIYLKKLFFPQLCHHCYLECENIICDRCLVGIELSDKTNGNVAYLFDHSIELFKKNRSLYQKIISSFCMVRLVNLGWEFGIIEAEPRLEGIKKMIMKNYPISGHDILYLIEDENSPKLLKPPRNGSYILII